jgi:hypothetical protein
MRFLATVALGSLYAFMPVAEAAASGSDVIDDCTKHGTLTRRYSQRDDRQALAQLPTDVDEYGDCRNVIHDAQNTSFTQGLPGPLLGVLSLLGVAALAAGVLALRRKLRGPTG